MQSWKVVAAAIILGASSLISSSTCCSVADDGSRRGGEAGGIRSAAADCAISPLASRSSLSWGVPSPALRYGRRGARWARQALSSEARSPTVRHEPMTRSRTVHSDTVRTIPHPGPTWDMTATGIRAHDDAWGPADQRPPALRLPRIAPRSAAVRRLPGCPRTHGALQVAHRHAALLPPLISAVRPEPSRPCLPSRSRH